jgi:hypothetical protein
MQSSAGLSEYVRNWQFEQAHRKVKEYMLCSSRSGAAAKDDLMGSVDRIPPRHRCDRWWWLAPTSPAGSLNWLFAALAFGLIVYGVALTAACKKNGVSLTEQRSGSRRVRLPVVRAKIVQAFLENYGVAIAEVARQMGISTSGASKILTRTLSI